MSRPWRQTLLVLLVALLAGMAGAWLGPQILARTHGNGTSFHEAVHRELDLTADQSARIDALERSFAVQRKALELEMRQANAELAAAIRDLEGLIAAASGTSARRRRWGTIATKGL